MRLDIPNSPFVILKGKISSISKPKKHIDEDGTFVKELCEIDSLEIDGETLSEVTTRREIIESVKEGDNVSMLVSEALGVISGLVNHSTKKEIIDKKILIYFGMLERKNGLYLFGVMAFFSLLPILISGPALRFPALAILLFSIFSAYQSYRSCAAQAIGIVHIMNNEVGGDPIMRDIARGSLKEYTYIPKYPTLSKRPLSIFGGAVVLSSMLGYALTLGSNYVKSASDFQSDRTELPSNSSSANAVSESASKSSEKIAQERKDDNLEPSRIAPNIIAQSDEKAEVRKQDALPENSIESTDKSREQGAENSPKISYKEETHSLGNSITSEAKSSVAPSFDCTKANTEIERKICRNSNLSALDSQLNSTYKEILKKTADSETLKVEQRSWIRNVRNQCLDEECIQFAYKSRIDKLLSKQ